MSKSFCTDRIFDKDWVGLFAGFSSSSQIFSQDSELVLFPGGKTFDSAKKNTNTYSNTLAFINEAQYETSDIRQ